MDQWYEMMWNMNKRKVWNGVEWFKVPVKAEQINWLLSCNAAHGPMGAHTAARTNDRGYGPYGIPVAKKISTPCSSVPAGNERWTCHSTDAN